MCARNTLISSKGRVDARECLAEPKDDYAPGDRETYSLGSSPGSPDRLPVAMSGLAAHEGHGQKIEVKLLAAVHFRDE